MVAQKKMIAQGYFSSYRNDIATSKSNTAIAMISL